MSTPRKPPLSVREGVNYWSQVAQHLATIRNDLDLTLPSAPEGMRGMSEDAVQAMREAFDEAVLAADAALGMCSRLAATSASPQPQPGRPQRTQQPYPATAAG